MKDQIIALLEGLKVFPNARLLTKDGDLIVEVTIPQEDGLTARWQQFSLTDEDLDDGAATALIIRRTLNPSGT